LRSSLLFFGLLLLVLLALGVPGIVQSADETAVNMPDEQTGLERVSGLVLDAEGRPVPGALVRIRTTENKTFSDSRGHFTLTGLTIGQSVMVTAWISGVYTGYDETIAGGGEVVVISLNPYYTTDNPEYTWFSHEGAAGSLSCSHCMPSYQEWIQDAHSKSALNIRFLTMYNGTDVNGNKSPLTRYVSSRDYGNVPMLPDPSKPYYGPGYKLDFPLTAGNCAACHVPGAAAYPGMAYAADPNLATGVVSEGVFCEFCHKIGEVILDSDTLLPEKNMPGVLSIRLYRPTGNQQLFFGNFDDVTRRVSYNPLYEQSAYCASCHYGVFWDTLVYNSYGEWLDSPYSDPDNGKTCQDCHMPQVDYNYFVYPEKGGLTRDPARIFSHRMPGAADVTLLQNTVTMIVNARREGEKVRVTVSITNDRAGHHVPTDSPLREMFLVVSALDAQGSTLELNEGSVLPSWYGVGDLASGNYAGLPGKAYEKVLEESWTEVYPTGAYWNQTRILSDTRLPALATDTTEYLFAASSSGKVRIEVQLLFRRAMIDLARQKGWKTPDILMESATLDIE
jgi:hypothetical protein